MKYLLLVYAEETTLTKDAMQACYAESTRLALELDAAGKYVGASPLKPTTTATSVRVRGGKPLITDGPFAETREQLGGFYLIDVADLDEAVAVAARIPGSRYGTIEIRPVAELPGLPAGALSRAEPARAE